MNKLRSKTLSTFVLALMLVSSMLVLVPFTNAATPLAPALGLSATSGSPSTAVASYITVNGTGFPSSTTGITFSWIRVTGDTVVVATATTRNPSVLSGAGSVDADSNGYFKVQIAKPQTTGGAYILRANYLVGTTATTLNTTFTITPSLSFAAAGIPTTSSFAGVPISWTVIGFGASETVSISGVTPSIFGALTGTTNANGAVTVNTAVLDVAGGAKTITATGGVSGLVASAGLTVRTSITGVPVSIRRTAGGSMTIGLHGFPEGTSIAANSITVGSATTSHSAATIDNTGAVAALPVTLTSDLSTQGLVSVTIGGIVFSQAGANINTTAASLLASTPATTITTAVLILDKSAYSVNDLVKVWGTGFTTAGAVSINFGGVAMTVTPALALDANGAFYTTFRVPNVAQNAADAARSVTFTGAGLDTPAAQVVTITPKLTASPSSGVFGGPVGFSGTGFRGDEDLAVTLGGAALATIPAASIVSGAFNTVATGTAVLTPTSVASFTMGNLGAGYTSAPAVTVAAPTGAPPVTATGTAVLTGTTVATIQITAAGLGYAAAPTVAISAPGGTGTTATATAAIDAAGSVISITLTNAGTGYTAAPTVTITPVGAAPTTPATAVATITPTSVASITLGVAGSGYTAAPTVTIAAPGGSGTTATATATLTPTSVASVTPVTGGLLYTVAPAVTFTSTSGSGAIATATIAGGSVTGYTMSANGAGYTSAPSVTIAPSLTLANLGGGSQAMVATGTTTTNTASATFTVNILIGTSSISVTTGATGTGVTIQTGATTGIHGLKASTRYNVVFGGEFGIVVGAFISTATGTVPGNARFVVPSGVFGTNIIDLVDTTATPAASAVWSKLTSTGQQYTNLLFALTASIQSIPSSGLVGNNLTITGTGLKSSTLYDVYWQTDLIGPLVAEFTTTAAGAVPAGITFAVPRTQAIATQEKTGTTIQIFVDDATGVNVGTGTFTLFASLSLGTTRGPQGTVVTLTGAGWNSGVNYAVVFGGDYVATPVVTGRTVATFTPNAEGDVLPNTFFTVPADLSAGSYWVDVVNTLTPAVSVLLQRIQFTIGQGGGTGQNGTNTFAPGTPALLNSAGSPATSITKGNTFYAAFNVTSAASLGLSPTVIAQMKDSLGRVVYIGLAQPDIASGATKTVQVPMIAPNAAGTYQVTLFVWDSISSATPLAPISTLSVTVA